VNDSGAPNGPLPGFEPPDQGPAPYPGQLPSYEQPPYHPGYQQAPYPGYPVMPPGMGAAPPMRRPGSVVLAFRLILLGAAIVAAMWVLNLALDTESLDRVARESLAQDGPYTESDVSAFKAGVIAVSVVFIAIPMTLIVVFGFVMRRGRNWARVTLTVLLSLGLIAAVITALVPVYVVVRLLAVVLFVVNVGILFAMFHSSADPYFDRRARMAGWMT
jgi:hypothetical protein